MFPAQDFWQFCSRLTINSKEMGAIRLAKPYGPQRWIIKKIAEGLDADILRPALLSTRSHFRWGRDSEKGTLYLLYRVESSVL